MAMARPNAISPVFVFFFFFSLIAENSDSAIIDIAIEKNVSLWVWIHRLTAKLPRPKLARRSVAFQQKAKTNEDRTALRLLNAFSI